MASKPRKTRKKAAALVPPDAAAVESNTRRRGRKAPVIASPGAPEIDDDGPIDPAVEHRLLDGNNRHYRVPVHQAKRPEDLDELAAEHGLHIVEGPRQEHVAERERRVRRVVFDGDTRWLLAAP